MHITDEQAMEYINGMATMLRKKVEIFESQDQETINLEKIEITADDRILFTCLEIVLNKAKANILFEQKEGKS